MPASRILVVEDEFLIRVTLAEMLEDAGYCVSEAESGDQAIGLLKDQPDIGLLLTDMHLAGAMNGSALAEAARAIRPALPVIFVTGRPDLVPANEADGLAVVAKPYTGAEIIAAVEKISGPAS